MKNIVTIDLDIIMEPSIMLYNSFTGHMSWDEAMKLSPYYNNLSFNANHYAKIFNYIMYVTPHMQGDQIFFLEDHGRVMNYIKESCSITNIDHHHDWGYTDVQVPDCASWVHHLEINGLLKNYHWINNKNSEISFQEHLSLTPKISLLENYNTLSTLGVPDQLYIVKSEPWIPPYYHSLYDIIMNYCNNYYKKMYSLDRRKFLKNIV